MSNLTVTDAVQNINSSAAQKQTPDNVRQAAQQFESLLLLQLTSSLNNSNDDGEDNLFGGDGGTGLAKQMFSEQLATTMANSGGVGLADLIVNQLGGKTPASLANKAGKFNNALAAVKNIKSEDSSVIESKIKNVINGKDKIALINKAAKFAPVASEASLSAANDFEIVSTAAEEIAKYGDADLPKPLIGDASKFVYMRPRIVPQHVLDAAALPGNVDQSRFESVAPSKETGTVAGAIAYQAPIVNSRISSGFGNRFHPIDHKNKFHSGIDFAAPKGTPIAASAGGTVVFAGWQNGYGNTVVIKHQDGKQTRYAHAEKLFVSAGETVSAGQEIAHVGSTGKSTGAHLHFEILENDRNLNPLEILAKDF